MENLLRCVEYKQLDSWRRGKTKSQKIPEFAKNGCAKNGSLGAYEADTAIFCIFAEHLSPGVADGPMSALEEGNRSAFDARAPVEAECFSYKDHCKKCRVD
jgi:hypothetical protein